MTLAVEYLHGVDVVHRDLKAENIVFAAKGSPVIKFIDFGGACTWTQEDGLTGLVGTPQYVAPEVVTGYGDSGMVEKSVGLLLLAGWGRPLLYPPGPVRPNPLYVLSRTHARDLRRGGQADGGAVRQGE